MFWKKRVYLDAASGLPVGKEAARAYARGVIEFGNPSSAHEEGRRAKEILEGARKDIARLTEVKSDDVIFTSGATEANALVILGLPKKEEHVLYLPSAHASVIENMNLLKSRGVAVEQLPIKQTCFTPGSVKKLFLFPWTRCVVRRERFGIRERLRK